MRFFIFLLSSIFGTTLAGRISKESASEGALVIGGWDSGVESYGCSIDANEKLPTELRGASAAVHNGNVHVCGTWSQDFESYPDCRMLENGEWSSAPLQQVPKSYHRMNTFGDKLISTGGYGVGDDRWLDTVEMFDGEKWEVSEFNLSVARTYHCSVAISDTELIMLGGQTSDGSIFLVTLPNIELFEEGKGWTNIGALNPPRYGHACALLDNEIIVSGGSADYQLVEALNLETFEWRQLPSTKLRRWDHSMEVVNGQLQIFGGLWEPFSMEWFDGEEWHVEQLQFDHSYSTTAVLPCA